MGKIVKVSGPLVVATGMEEANMADVVRVGEQRLIGEILNMTGDAASIQVYEETSGLGPGAEVVTTGAPLCAIIENTNQRSKDYSSLRVLPRPGHADYTAYVKYGNHHDVRGGGHFSGRLTAPLVFAGAIARQLLQRRGILVASHVASIGEAQDQPFDPVSIPPQLLERLGGEYFPVIDAAAKERMRQVVELSLIHI